MTTILYILLAIAILLLMILIHEFGHYVIGRMLNFKINEFSIGFGKALFQKKNRRGETISLRIIPLGGYCAFDGENDTPDNPDAFNNQAPWKRILVFLAGVTFNFAAAVIFSILLLCTVGYDIPHAKEQIEFTPTAIENYVEGSYYNKLTNLELALQEGDVIVSIDGNSIDFAYGTTYQDQHAKAFAGLQAAISNAIGELEGEEAKVAERNAFDLYNTFTPAIVKRNGEYKEIQLSFYRIEKYDIVDNEKVVLTDADGLPITDVDGNPIYKTSYFYGWNEVKMGAYVHTFGEAVERAVPFSFGLAWKVLESFWQMITFQLDIGSIGGPISTISSIATYAQSNILNLLILIPLISANLAIFNILPIPALDGSHVIFTLIEWIRKKPVKREVESLIHTIGLFVLFALVILVDILHFIL